MFNDFFGNLATAVQQTVAAVIGGQATYRRGADLVPLSAAPGQSDHEVWDPGSGALTAWRSRDWLVRRGELVIGGNAVEPRRGDEILIPLAGGLVEVYVVQHPDPARAPWRFADPTDQVYRIHSTLDRTEPAPA